MKKLLFVLFLSINSFSAIWFCHPGLGTGSNDGTTTDDAWNSMATAFAATSMSPGDTLFIRRVRATYAANLAPNVDEDGTLTQWYHIVGCPRDTLVGTADFHQGYRVITNSSITPDLYHHATRFISNNLNHRNYMITSIALKINYDNESGNFAIGEIVTDATSGAIGKVHYLVDAGTTGSLWVTVQTGTFGDDNNITGSIAGAATINGAPTVDGFVTLENYVDTTNTGGNFTIPADEYYEQFMSINDAAWTIKIADWDADNDSLPRADFTTGAYNLYNNGAYMWRFTNICFAGGSSSGTVYTKSMSNQIFFHCIFQQSNNVSCFYSSSSSAHQTFGNCIFIGSSAGSAQIGCSTTNGMFTIFRNVAIYNMGDNGVNCEYGEHYFYNCNFGIDLPNDDYDIVIGNHNVYAEDCGFGGLNGTITCGNYYRPQFFSYNHNRVFGDNRQYLNQGYFVKTPVIAGSGNPEKRTGGSDFVIALTENHRSDGFTNFTDKRNLVFEQSFVMDTTPRNYRFYCQAEAMSATVQQIRLEVKYCSKNLGTTTYYMQIDTSDETISTRTGADDWTQYIEVTGVAPDTTGLVRASLYADFYDADGVLYIDPKCSITE
jgi:hypothetical protein